jgi:uncharacterized protein (DUF488 family)
VAALYTIGHSRHPSGQFVELLRRHGIETLVDVRSHPVSRFAPQFNRKALAASLEDAGVEYEFAGDTMGGRPSEREYYDSGGYVLYGRVAESERFLSALRQIRLRLQGGRRMAVMCAEEDPSGCHRHLLVGRVLEREGVEIRHIRADGRIDNNIQVGYPEGERRQGRLFEEDMEAWRSVRPVESMARASPFSH